MPDVPAASRQRALDAILDAERRFLPALRKAIEATWRRALRALDPDVAVLSAGAPPDPRDLISMRSEWEKWVNRDLAPIVTDIYADSANDAFKILGGDASYFSVDSPAGQQQLREASNRLVGIGDDFWARAQGTLAEGMADGLSIDEMAANLRDDLQSGMVRAERIARTEVIGAQNGGAMAGAKALGDDAPPYKQWLATLDGRTRPEHAAADGQTVPLDENFDVGGESLDYPGDPGGSPGNVINCRCTWIAVDAPADVIERAGRQSLTEEEVVDREGQLGQVLQRAAAREARGISTRRLAAPQAPSVFQSAETAPPRTEAITELDLTRYDVGTHVRRYADSPKDGPWTIVAITDSDQATIRRGSLTITVGWRAIAGPVA